jgi:hypothetical protein
LSFNFDFKQNKWFYGLRGKKVKNKFK